MNRESWFVTRGLGRIRRTGADYCATGEQHFLLRLENVISCVLSEFRRFLISGVLRLAARAFSSPAEGWSVEIGNQLGGVGI